MVSTSIIIPLDVNLSSTTPLNNLFFHHCSSHGITEKTEFENFEMLDLGLNE